MLPEITDFGLCKVCGWGDVEKFQNHALTYQEFGQEMNDFGIRYERRMQVKCGRCDFIWYIGLKDEIKGDPARFEKEKAENPSSTTKVPF